VLRRRASNKLAALAIAAAAPRRSSSIDAALPSLFGRFPAVAPDVVVWTPPASRGPHLLQAAVHGDDAAAVASFTWPEVA
jgi:hypothetical protein